MSISNPQGLTAGRSNSARNALKRGVFTNTLMPEEDPDAVEQVVENLCNQFQVDDASGEILVRRFVQNTMKIKRLDQAQADYAEGYMHSEQARHEFCDYVGLSQSDASELPSWYFFSDEESGEKARYIMQVRTEALDLKEKHSADLMVSAKKRYPDLWHYVMGAEGSHVAKLHGLGERLMLLFKETSAPLNLQALVAHLEKRYRFEIYWAQDEERYTSVVCAIRAKAELDAMTNPNWTRADSLYHRKTQDLLATLISILQSKRRGDFAPIEFVALSTTPARKRKITAKVKTASPVKTVAVGNALADSVKV